MKRVYLKMDNESYVNVSVLSAQGQRTRRERQRAGPRPAEVPHTNTSEAQDIQEKTLTDTRRMTGIYLLVAVGFMVVCALQLSLNIFLRVHYMSSTEIEQLQADINNLTSVKSAEIFSL